MKKLYLYLLTGILFWVVVDYTTAFNPDFRRWLSYMPDIWLYYIGYPILFSILIYQFGLRRRKLLGAVLFMTLFMEIVLFHNTLLTTFPILLIMIPIAFLIYGFITYMPYWIVEGTLKKNRVWVILFIFNWFVISVLSYATTSRGMG